MRGIRRPVACVWRFKFFTALALLYPATWQCPAQTWQFVRHEIRNAPGPLHCDVQPGVFPKLVLDKSSDTLSFNYRPAGGSRCPGAWIPDGQITVSFPATFQEGVAFPGAVGVQGTLMATDAAIRNQPFLVDTVIDRLLSLEDSTVFPAEDLTRAPCPLVRFRKEPPLAIGPDTSSPGLNPFSAPATCGVRAPLTGQRFEGSNLVIVSSVKFVIGDAEGSPTLFTYRGWYIFGFAVYSIYRGTSTPPSLKPRLTVSTEVTAGKESEIKIEAVKEDGLPDTSYNGTVRVSLAAGSTEGIGLLQSGSGQPGSSLSLSMAGGKLKDILVLQTPGVPLTAATIINPTTVLEGTAIVRAELESSPGRTDEQPIRVRSPLDLGISRVEVQQGVLLPDEGPWVRGNTLIRIFVDANRQEFDRYQAIEGITASLTIQDSTGKKVERRVDKGKINSRNVPNESFVFKPNGPPDLHGADSLNQFVTLEGLNPPVTVDAKLDGVIPDKDPANNSKSRTLLQLSDPRRLTVVYYQARFSGLDLPSAVGITRSIKFMRDAFPMPSSLMRFVRFRKDHVLSRSPLPLGKQEKGYWLNFKNADRNKPLAYVYFVDRASMSGIHPRALGVTKDFVVAVNVDPCAEFSLCGTLDHEIGHVLDLGDTYQDPLASPSANNPRLPNATDAGNQVEDGNFSFFDHLFSYAPDRFLDFMGTDAPKKRFWIDAPTWRHLANRLTVLAQAENRTPPAQTDNLFVVVNGVVTRGGSARLDDSYTLRGGNSASASAPAGSHIVETLNANSVVLNSVAFTPQFRWLDSPIEQDETNFSLALPFSSSVKQIRLRSGPTILASRGVSTNAPIARFASDFAGQTLNGIRTVTWTGSDLDGDPLSYALFYSPDGELQIPLISETTATQYDWNTEDSPSGPSPRLTLMATDGVNATLIESPPFALPNRAPEVVVLSPREQSQFVEGQTVLLEGALLDPEDDMPDGPELVWTSDLQGVLGTGELIEVANLRVGAHRITATGADSQGAQGSASVVVHIVVGGAALCDLNGDAQVNILDVQFVINRILFLSGNSDVNCDGQTNVLDAQVLINVALGGACPSCGPSTTTSSATTTTTTTSTTTTRPPTTTTTTTSTTSTRPPTTTTTTTTLPPTQMFARGSLDSPVNGQVVSGIVNGAGWAFIQIGNTSVLPSRVDILIDGSVVAQGAGGLPRPDVRDAFAAQGITVPANSGYTFTWNSAMVSAGPHTLSVRVGDAFGTSAEALYEIAQISIVVAAQTNPCNLFAEDFSNASLPGWSFSNADWQVVDGKLHAGAIVDPSFAAIAVHALPVPHLFRMTMDVAVDVFNGPVYGFVPFSTIRTFRLASSGGGSIAASGLGVWVGGAGQVGFMAYDVNTTNLFALNLAAVAGPVNNIGIQWAANGVTLLLNGNALQAISPQVFVDGYPSPPALDQLYLVSSGSLTQIRFDNICQGSP